MHKTFPKRVPNMSQTCPGDGQNVGKACPKTKPNMSQTCPEITPDMSQTCPKMIPDMSQAWPKMTPDMSKIHAKYVNQTIFENGRMWHLNWDSASTHQGSNRGSPAPEPEGGPLGYVGCVVPYISYIPEKSFNLIELLELRRIHGSS